MTDPAEPQPDDAVKPDAAQDLANAYVELAAALKPGLHADLARIGASFAKAIPTRVLANPTGDLLDRIRPSFSLPADQSIEIPDFEPDPTPGVIAGNTARMADIAAQQNQTIARLVELTLDSLEEAKAQNRLAEQQRKENAESARFAKGMAWASVLLTAATVGVSVAALLVARG